MKLSTKLFAIASVFTCLAFLYGCNQGGETATEDTTETETVMEEEMPQEPAAELAQDSSMMMMSDGITIVPVLESPEFPDASLSVTMPAADASLPVGSANFSYDVQNYELGGQTGSMLSEMCANSGKGQHIHFIVNNQPYLAKYESSFSYDFPEAGNYVVLSFLSRSFHESIKSADAYTLAQYTVGDGGEPMDLTQPLLFYSRPKGEYTGADAQNVLLDFFVANTRLSETGNKVKLTINGQTEFMLPEWRPYILKGLPMGEHTFEIELVDSEGNLVGPEFNRVSRTFQLSELQ